MVNTHTATTGMELYIFSMSKKIILIDTLMHVVIKLLQQVHPQSTLRKDLHSMFHAAFP